MRAVGLAGAVAATLLVGCSVTSDPPALEAKSDAKSEGAVFSHASGLKISDIKEAAREQRCNRADARLTPYATALLK